MSTHECWTVGIGIATTLIGAAGLIGLWYYVRETKKIADATKLQGDVLSRPAISVLCSEYPHGEPPYFQIATVIENHTNVHANFTVKIIARLLIDGKGTPLDFSAEKPYDGTVWPFTARQKIEGGHFKLKDLDKQPVGANDVLTLHGEMKSTWWGSDDLREDPPFLYRWDNRYKRWVVYPPET
jgi:hypothetical protein